MAGSSGVGICALFSSKHCLCFICPSDMQYLYYCLSHQLERLEDVRGEMLSHYATTIQVAWHHLRRRQHRHKLYRIVTVQRGAHLSLNYSRTSLCNVCNTAAFVCCPLGQDSSFNSYISCTCSPTLNTKLQFTVPIVFYLKHWSIHIMNVSTSSV